MEKEMELKYLKSLAKLYPSVAAASTEIINLQSVLNLPKGTEHFMTDLHGEYEQFFDAVFAFSCYSGSGFVFYVGLFETYVLYIASKETNFFTIVVFQDLGYVTADGEEV